MSRFDYIKYDETAQKKQDSFHHEFDKLERMAEAMLPDGRARKLFLVALEQAYMWTGKSIRDDQIVRTNQTAPSLKDEK